MKKDPNRYPKGLNRRDVEALIRRMESQSDDEAISEADSAWENRRVQMIPVPTELVGKVEALIARHQPPRRSKPTRARRPKAA